MTGNHTISEHQHTANNRNDPVPYSWQTSGPITLAGDSLSQGAVDALADSWGPAHASVGFGFFIGGEGRSAATGRIVLSTMVRT